MRFNTLQKNLAYYQRLMMIAKTTGDMHLHETCKQIAREISRQIREKAVCHQQTAQTQNFSPEEYHKSASVVN